MQLTASDVGYVRAIARRMVGEADADDVMQDALLLAYRKRDRFEGRSQLRTWLYRITVNAALSALRARRRRRLVLEERDVVDPAGTPLDDLTREELESLVWRGIDDLDAKYRDVFVRRYLHGQSETVVAGALGLTVSTVKIRAFRVRNKLRDLVAA